MHQPPMMCVSHLYLHFHGAGRSSCFFCFGGQQVINGMCTKCPAAQYSAYSDPKCQDCKGGLPYLISCQCLNVASLAVFCNAADACCMQSVTADGMLLNTDSYLHIADNTYADTPGSITCTNCPAGQFTYELFSYHRNKCYNCNGRLRFDLLANAS
jgi:hypothetical protein